MKVATASLIVSVLASMVARIALHPAHRETRASEATARIEQDRRNEEIAQAKSVKSADVTAGIMDTLGNKYTMIGVHNAGPARASDVFVIFIGAHDSRPTANIDWHRLRGEVGPGRYQVCQAQAGGS